MKKISKLMVVVVVLTGVLYVGAVGLAQTSSAGSTTQSASYTIQHTWVLIGYHFDSASNPRDITQLYGSLPGFPPTSLKALFDQWKAGVITRQKVRPAVLAYARSAGGYEAIESFRLGEWCHRILALEKVFKSNVESNNSHEAFSNMVDMEFLARQAQEFIDILPGTTPKDVIDGLNKIALASTKMDVIGVLNRTASADDFTTAILSLPKYVAQIIAVYLLGSL